MTSRPISRYILLCISSLLLLQPAAWGQRQKPRISIEADTVPLISGGQIYFNLAGAVLWQVSSYGELEGGARLNIRNKYFPTVEAGMGFCNKTDDGTDLRCKTSAPFIRLGCDYNFARDKASGNRIYGGLRAGYTTFKYDLSGPSVIDPYWQGQQMDISLSKVSCNAYWAEFLFGLETKIWRNFHLGWTIRYKRRLHYKDYDLGNSYYLPGYGKNSDHLFTGTFNLVFDI
ncbi:MAG: hypothetical protein J5729_00220 [Bacteroidaceae bacterium]|nr:hypothetical protein [Bacteroidaceae bacterium]